MRRVDVQLLIAAGAFVAGAWALVDVQLLGAGIALLAVATLAVFSAVLAATTVPPAQASPDDDEDPDGDS